jgi:hypothetical protein
MEITVEYLDRSKEVFPETSRFGGSYCTTGKTENGWYVIQDANGSRTNIPSDRSKTVRTREVNGNLSQD